ncbi:hypothetical protein RRSWK_04903 [Rhodopirellula sp. SWK7]|nr:hypothetical protein RRSWK_04903 [Rhodopirellula sp. SWK7]
MADVVKTYLFPGGKTTASCRPICRGVVTDETRDGLRCTSAKSGH